MALDTLIHTLQTVNYLCFSCRKAKIGIKSFGLKWEWLTIYRGIIYN